MTSLDPTVTSTLDPYGGTQNAQLEERMIADPIALNIQSALKMFGGAAGFSLAPSGHIFITGTTPGPIDFGLGNLPTINFSDSVISRISP